MLGARAPRGRAPRTVALAVLLGLLFVPVREIVAQDGGGGHRKWLFAALGAVVAGVPALVFNEGRTLGSNCSDDFCVTAVAGALGAGIGWLIGNEMDSQAKRRMAAGPSIEYDFRDVPVGLVPDRIVGFSGGAAVIGLGGARVILRDGTVFRRGSGVRGLEDVAAVPALDLLVLSTTANLLAFPVRGEEVQGRVIDERGGGAMAAVQENLAVAGLDSLRLLRLRGEATDISVETASSREHFGFVFDMAFSPFSGVTWVLVEDRLTAYSRDLERVGELTLPAAGRSVRARGGRLAVAAGTNGVYVVDARDPSVPRVVQQFTGVRFAYSADLAQDRLYVAGGPEGLVVVDISGAEPRVLGVARAVKLASDVSVSEDGSVWILDRDGQKVQIATFGRGD